MTKLYANIGIGHENSYTVLEKRIVAAAQCNADAVIINKSTPHLVIPEHKKYVAIASKWGTLPYIEVAKKSEISNDTAEKIYSLSKNIGIPIIWSVTDSMSAEFVRDYSFGTIKLHIDSVDVYDLARYCHSNFDHVIYNIHHQEHFDVLNKKSMRKNFSIYYTTKNFPPAPMELNYSEMDIFLKEKYNVGYEGREAGIFPAMSLVYKGLSHIEKYLSEDSDNPSVLSPEQFYDLFESMMILENANSGNLK